MKFALIHDNMAISSYYIKDDTAYAFKGNTFNDHRAEKDKPYVYHHAVSPQCYIAMQNLPFLFEEGYYLNWHEWKELPTLDLELIFFGCEKNWNPDGTIRRNDVSVKILRNKYPNAKILGWVKELSVGNETQNLKRLEELNHCDGVVTSGVSEFKYLDVFKDFKKVVDKQFHFVPQPVNTEYLFNNFYSNEKEECLFIYAPNPIPRRANTFSFVSHLSNKYNIPMEYKELKENQKYDYLSQKEFIELWSKYSFHFNLDPFDIQPGNQCMQVACTGTINIGGMNESHNILFPDTATCDVVLLENKFVEYLNDYELRSKAIEYAWNKVNEVFSFDVVREQIKNIYLELST